MADPWPIIDPYFKDARNGSWVYATVMADIVRDLGYIEEDAEGEHPHEAIDEKWIFARGRLRAHLFPKVTSPAGPFADIAKGPLRPILAGTLYNTYGPGAGPGRIELGISHGFDGVTTTTMSFSNGYEMTMVDATYAAPSDTYICQVGGSGPNNQDHAVITLHEGLLRFIRGEIPRPLGRPNLDWPGGFRHPHWH